MEPAAALHHEEESLYTEEGLIRILPSEWADGYAQRLTVPHSDYNKTLAPLLGVVLLNEKGITRLQVAGILADREGLPKMDAKLLDRVERTRKRLDQILPGLVLQDGKGAEAVMKLERDRFSALTLSPGEEESARHCARNLTQERIARAFRAQVYHWTASVGKRFKLTDLETSILRCICFSHKKGHQPYIVKGISTLSETALRSLLAKLPAGVVFKEGESYFMDETIQTSFGEYVGDYASKEARIENPKGPYPLSILAPAPDPAPTPKVQVPVTPPPQATRTNRLPPDAATMSLARLHREYPWYITVFPHMGFDGGKVTDAQIADYLKRKQPSLPPTGKKKKLKKETPDGWAALKATMSALDSTEDDS